MTAGVVSLPAVVVPQTALAAKFGARTLATGMSGGDVKTAQILLRRAGDATLTADGEFGPATRRAVQRFESTAGLPANGRLETTEAPMLRTAAATAVAQRRSAMTASGDTVPADDPLSGAGGASPTATTPAPAVEVPGAKAVLNADGTATAPASAPPEVKAIIASGNEIASKPYRYGGGHGRWIDSGYDCSGSVSYALHGAGLLDQSMPSGSFTTWGESGDGTWVTIYAKGSHMYMVVAGLRFDTSGARPSRWQKDMRSSSGYTIRHPEGL
ncbi:NlpC/P60 family protein [Capillimicrobium parvum]|uniref:NlpC/P60 family protein n=1 Tax=Capillimicrobium parvum TaxID=2884022 RepID=UPI00216B58A5|nr:peptidoglycan-binding protein [Capillimicrobium parvum]